MNSDDRSQLLLPILIKHLDNKNVSKQQVLQMHIVNVATQLSEHVKPHASVTIVGAIADLIKHLRKCLQRSSEMSIPKEDSDSCNNTDLQFALENCISNLSCKVCNASGSCNYIKFIFGPQTINESLNKVLKHLTIFK